MLKNIISTWLLFSTIGFNFLLAAPWISTSDLYLRADIETLADIGIIKVPITTYPLMWSGIIKDLDQADLENISIADKMIYWRVKKLARKAISKREQRQLKLTVASGEQVLRSFGDGSRGETSLSASYSNMSKYFAWNIQVNRVSNPLDDDNVHFDDSYIAGIVGNWVISLGSIEKWWGASWDSANLLSNNARVPLGLNINRNYSETNNLPVLDWLGSWTMSGFINPLKETTELKDGHLMGASFSFKPFNALETSIRTTSLHGRKEKETLTKVKSKIINGIDLQWHLPISLLASNHPSNLYWSATDENQKGNFSTQLYGLSSSFNFFEQYWRVFLESSQTLAEGATQNDYNTTYEDSPYTQGYRINQRSIGSTYDNDSSVISLGLIGRLSKYQTFSVKIQDIKINLASQLATIELTNQQHSISSNEVHSKRFVVKWQLETSKNNRFEFEIDYSDKIIDEFGRQKDKTRLSASWNYYL